MSQTAVKETITRGSKPKKPKLTPSKIENIVFHSFNTVFLITVVLVTLYPYWNTIVVSFNEAADTIMGGITFWPRKLSMKNYEAVFVTGTIIPAFMITISRTILDVVLNVFFSSMLAYSLSRKEFLFRKPFTIVVILTMYVSAGLIPGYFLIRSLGLINNFMVYVVPWFVGAFNFLIIRTYMNTIPESLVESARMDGAGDFRIFIRIMLPLCKPVLATISLFVAVGAWNTWFDTLLYTSGRQELSTLQYELMKFLSNSMQQSKSAADVGAAGMAVDSAASMVTPMAVRAAATVVASLPILLVYPFLQRHFVKGINVGGVKE